MTWKAHGDKEVFSRRRKFSREGGCLISTEREFNKMELTILNMAWLLVEMICTSEPGGLTNSDFVKKLSDQVEI